MDEQKSCQGVVTVVVVVRAAFKIWISFPRIRLVLDHVMKINPPHNNYNSKMATRTADHTNALLQRKMLELMKACPVNTRYRTLKKQCQFFDHVIT